MYSLTLFFGGASIFTPLDGGGGINPPLPLPPPFEGLLYVLPPYLGLAFGDEVPPTLLVDTVVNIDLKMFSFLPFLSFSVSLDDSDQTFPSA